MKKIFLLCVFAASFFSCDKKDKEFELKSIKLISYDNTNLPIQNLQFQIVQAEDDTTILTSTEIYPNNLPLPIVLGTKTSLSSQLYKNSYIIQLWGDSTGLIGSARVKMSNYKIIFPIEMEVESERMTISLSGSWR